MKFKSALITLTATATLLTITGCGKQAKGHDQSSSSSSKVIKSSSSSSSDSSSMESSSSSSNNNDSSNASISTSDSSSSVSSSGSSSNVSNSWVSSVPDELSGTWKNKHIEFVFSNNAADCKYIDQVAAWSGEFWNPKFKSTGNNTYEVHSGDDGSMGTDYKIIKTGDDTAKITVGGQTSTVTRTSNKVTDHN